MAAFPRWDVALLHSIGAPPTPENLRYLNAWQRAEGGTARYNPLNTTQSWRGASSYNSVGVRNYPTPQAGVQATAHTLLDPRYQQIVGLLRSGRSSATQTAQALARSPWGTGAGVLKVLGSGGGTGGAPMALPAASPTVQAAPGPNLQPARRALAQNLIAASQATAQHQTPDYSQTFQLVAAIRRPPMPGSPPAQAIPVVAQAGVSSGKASQVVSLAQRFLGTPYRWGGSKPGGFDCSGLLQYVWGQRGVKIPRTSQQQFKAGVPIGKGQLRPGDAVFFEGSTPGHVGMYIGGGKFIEAPHTGAVVRISNLAGRSDYVGARRFVR